MYPIEGFPIDGRLWWLRWFDHPAWNGITSTATVTVALSRLPRATRADASQGNMEDDWEGQPALPF